MENDDKSLYEYEESLEIYPCPCLCLTSLPQKASQEDPQYSSLKSSWKDLGNFRKGKIANLFGSWRSDVVGDLLLFSIKEISQNQELKEQLNNYHRQLVEYLESSGGSSSS